MMTYRVSVNGKPLPVYPARSSAVPFNRVWEGKQRDPAQSEIAYFVTFDMDAPVTLTAEIQGADIRQCELRPAEYEIPFSVSGNTVTVTLDRPRKFTLEVNGYREVLQIFANEPDTFVPDENTIYFGPGEHDAGMIFPKTGQTVYLAEGAVVYGGLYIYRADHVRILGRGILDSSRLPRGNQLTPEDALYGQLASLGITPRDIRYYSGFNAYGCRDLTVDGIILRDAPLWVMIVRNRCDGVLIRNVKIVGQWRYNADGIDLCDSDNVTVDDCYVRSFDDCIVVRGPYLDGEETGCRNYDVKNCVLWCDWGKNLEIWSGGKRSVISNIRFSDIHVIRGCNHAASIDTWFGSDATVVENVVYDGITVDVRGEQLCPVMQNSDDQVYASTGTSPLDAVYVGVGKLGRDLGNQQCDFNVDPDDFDIRYRNVTWKNFRTVGKELRARVFMKNLRECSGLVTENCEFSLVIT